METMAEWFGLKAEHSDFSISNDDDAAMLFARSELDDNLKSILRRAFRTSKPPKFVLYGDWGVGKTHMLRHMEYVIRTESDFRAYVVFVELPDINQKSTFQVVHAALLDALGSDRARNWIALYQSKYGAGASDSIQALTQSGDIARAFLSLAGYGETARIAWDFLRGEPLSATDARNVGLPPRLEQSNQLVGVLRMLGVLCSDAEERMLIFMLDEATKVKNVTNGDAINHWVNAFKILADDNTKEVGVIISASFRDVDEMPEALSDQQVLTRIGEKHYIQLSNFGIEEAAAFCKALVSEWVEPAGRMARIEQHASESDMEPVSDASYPFTEPAMQHFVGYTCRNGSITSPRDIQKALDNVLNRAMDDDRHIISYAYLEYIINS